MGKVFLYWGRSYFTEDEGNGVMGWGKYKLVDICVSIADGDHQPPPKADSGIPFVTISNITSTNKFDFTNTMFVPQKYYDRLDDKRKAHVGDVLYSIVGSFGIPVFISEEQQFVFQRHIAILRPDKEKIIPEFLFYTMLSRDFYMKADAVALGAAQRTISLSALRSMEIEVPPCEIQKKIVNYLKPYDHLIQNNQKQIKLLEEAAQRLYKEWFVDLRFPGYEKCKIVDGVPEGWKKGKADGFFEITIGKTPPRAEKQWFVSEAKGTKWVSISDMGKAGPFVINTSEELSEDAVKKYKVKIIPKDTILVSFKLTVGRVAMTVEDMCTNEAIAHFCIVDSTLREYTYMYLKAFEYDTLGNTSSISKAVNSKIIKSMPFIMPTKYIINLFSNKVKPLLDLIYAKQCTIISAVEVRDRLLKKMMIGEIEV